MSLEEFNNLQIGDVFHDKNKHLYCVLERYTSPQGEVVFYKAIKNSKDSHYVILIEDNAGRFELEGDQKNDDNGTISETE